MQEVVREYGAIAVASVGGFLFFAVIGKLLAPGGVLAQMILLWGNGGC